MIKNILISGSLLGSLLLPWYAFAAPSLLLTLPPEARIGDVVLIPVQMLVPEEASINALSARVRVIGPATLSHISTGGSVFTLWPEMPRIDAGVGTFLGGGPGSVYGSPLRLVTLALTIGGSGTVTIMIDTIRAYADDGRGTSVAVKDYSAQLSTISDTQSPHDAYAQLLARDTRPPDAFSVLLGRDTTADNGPYFISFSTTDSESGIREYAIQENDDAWIPATSPYVLLDQTVSGKVSVRSVDNAGNIRVETLDFRTPPWYDTWVALIVGVIGLLFSVWYLRKR